MANEIVLMPSLVQNTLAGSAVEIQSVPMSSWKDNPTAILTSRDQVSVLKMESLAFLPTSRLQGHLVGFSAASARPFTDAHRHRRFPRRDGIKEHCGGKFFDKSNVNRKDDCR